MTGFFDDLRTRIREIPRNLPPDEFVRVVAGVEEGAVRAVLLNAADPEFPDDLRRRILGVVASSAVWQPDGQPVPEEARDYVLTMRCSDVLEELHSLFHVLAGRRIPTRFGRWTDSPRQNLLSMDEHDREPGGSG